MHRPPVKLPGDFLWLVHARNPGAAFSFAEGATVVFTAVAAIVIVVIVRTASKLRSTAWAISLGLVLGGAAGNLVDRLFRSPAPLRGWVVDWISLRSPDGRMLFPIFNLADSGIVCGGILAVLLALLGVRDGRHPRRQGRAGHGGTGSGDPADSAAGPGRADPAHPRSGRLRPLGRVPLGRADRRPTRDRRPVRVRRADRRADRRSTAGPTAGPAGPPTARAGSAGPSRLPGRPALPGRPPGRPPGRGAWASRRRAAAACRRAAGGRRPRAAAAVAERRTVPVPDGLDGLRLDAALARLFGFSRTTAATLVDTGGVTVDGARPGPVRPGHRRRLARGRHARAAGPAERGTRARPRPHRRVSRTTTSSWSTSRSASPPIPPRAGTDPTVIQGVAAMGHRLSTSGAAERQGVVHRLDVGTTGLMVLAKSERAYRVLKDAFRDRTVDKRYAALVQGHPDPTRGTIDAPIDRHPGSDWKFAVVAGGRPSVTHYDTIEAFRAATLLDVKLETGRTHQIRVHLAAVRHPLVGDLTYGADPTLAERLGLHRQWLHAARLGFAHPATGEWVEFTSPYPDDLARALALVSE